MAGALAGLRIVEFLGIGPGPFAGMMLADHGAEVIRVGRPGAQESFGDFDRFDVLARSRRTIAIDMKSADGLAIVRDLVGSADGLIEGFRPGVMERLGLGPDTLITENPRLVYGRMTGWGQDGPLAQSAGHDINYVAINGVLSTVGRPGERPVVPVNYTGDFGGGGMLLAFGMVTALLAVARGASGQVVDAAMVDGSALLSGMVWQMKAAGMWNGPAGANLLDGGAHFYDTFACADGRYVTIGAIEPQFYVALRRILGLAEDQAFDEQMDRARWPALREKIAAVIATRARDEWCTAFEGHDACFAPVMTLDEAPGHPHIAARGTLTETNGQIQPAPAPRLSATPPLPPRPPRRAGQDTEIVLSLIGYSAERIAALRASGVIA
ncbi:CoA transferase [Sphingomonas sp. CGMCC 1.13654]|uniref:CoA transferase n=1 Tax=Sphingomonas chungangi TaxID=2683589 RepID=A0A838L2Z1_9SPHN|nr:CaiB/BaiF CoA-transferase family protein [Sphingomonas chungangi]MBA2933761.1 CoA transferase [Sphingomonas chungangi]MVW55092.1 CoA transferase [Sphingomonas chungangi]